MLEPSHASVKTVSNLTELRLNLRLGEAQKRSLRDPRVEKSERSADPAPARQPKSTYVTIEANVTAAKKFTGMETGKPYLLKVIPRAFDSEGKVHIDITDVIHEA